MKRFTFRLETVLGHRRALLSEEQRKFGRAQNDVGRLERAIFSLDTLRRDCQAQIREAATGQMQRTEMLRLRSYANALWLQVLSAAHKLGELRAELEERRRALIRARQGVRALELLREKALREWRTAAGREERAFLDDLQLTAGLLVPPAAAGGEA
jgi:flagellar export protein FliJ